MKAPPAPAAGLNFTAHRWQIQAIRMNDPTFSPAHSALLCRADLSAIAALLDSHPDCAAASKCLKFLAERSGAGTDPDAVLAYQEAAQTLARDGEIEVDLDAAISMGDDGGAYVQAWLWVSDEAAGMKSET